MVLVEVIELIVDVDRGWDVTVDVKFDLAHCIVTDWASLTVLFHNALNTFAHDVESDSEGQEDHTEDAKDDHRRAKRRNRSPGREHLLLEFALLQLFNLFLNADEVFF